MGQAWQVWLMSGGIALLVTAITNWPKLRGEGRQADGAGQKSVTDAQIALQTSTLAEARASAANANASAAAADRARDECRAEAKALRIDFEIFIDAMEPLVGLLPEAERLVARQAIRTAKHAV